MQDVIKVTNLVKTYRMYEKPIHRLKEVINPKKVLHNDFYALNNVSFTISKGETVGIIGKNGSGKSTLLKILTEVLTPTSGEVSVNGKVSALLELGAGFNPEYTGIQNIYLNGSVLGFDKKEMDEKLQEILDFAELGDFIYQPVKTYSSGMFVRLAFAVAINVEPDILIIDEALSVGDIRFQQKCFRKIEEFKKKKTVIFVSHDMSTIINHCERAIWINEGELLADGDPIELSKRYRAFMMNLDSEIIGYDDNEDDEELISEEGMSFNSVANLEMFGDLKAEITGVSLQDANTEQMLTVVEPQQKVRLLIKCKLNEKIEEALIVGFTIKDRLGNIVTQSNSYALNSPINPKNRHFVSSFEFDIPNLTVGTYTISPAIASGIQEDHMQHCWIHDAILFDVVNKGFNLLEGYLFLSPITCNLID